MFADIGHGFILFMIGLYLCFFEEKIRKTPGSSFKVMLPARYLVALMGLFAFYNGIIYNDYLSISLNLFGSCFEETEANDEKQWTKKADCIYPFGLDPVWAVSDNSLTFINPYKMK
jgi:V-type H+-transporting ATPase subunit a